MNRAILLLCAVVVAAALLPADASAHANYVSSTPAPDSIFPYNATPSSVTITLSEAVESGTGTVRVTNATGTRFDMPPVTLSGAGRTMSVGMNRTGSGIITVTWSAVSADDGHFTAGSFAWCVQNPDPNGTGCSGGGLGQTSSGAPVSPFEVGLRFIGFFGLAAALGASVLGAFMWIPAGRDPDVKEAPGYRLGFQIVMNVARIGAFGFALAFAGLFLLTDALESTGGGSSVVGSPYKLSVVLSLAIGAVLFIALSSAFMHARKDPPESTHGYLLLSTVLGFAAIAIGSAGTHAAAVQSLGGISNYFGIDPLAPLNAIAPAIGTVADAAHIAGVALWVGGLATIFATRSFLREPASVPLARVVLGRFSAMAFYCVGLVLIGGLILALLLVGSWDALFSSGYGWVILAKVSLFIPMIAFGAYNRYRLIPRATEMGEPAAAFRQLTWNVRNETALGATVLVLAAILASLTPAISVFAGSTQFTLSDTVDGIHIQMLIDPPPATANISYTVQFLLTWASNGSAYNFGKNTSVITFRSETNVLLPPQTLPLDGPHGNHFFITTLAMSQPGTWSIQPRFVRFGNDLITTFHVVLTGGS